MTDKSESCDDGDEKVRKNWIDPDSRPGYKLIFRRFRKLPSGAVLDAYRYGKKAWPMWVKDES